MGRRSPFVITLTKQDRRKLEARAGRPTAEQRQALHARIVLAAAGGQSNRRIAARLGVVPNTVCKWRKRFAEQGLAGLEDRPRSGSPARFPPAVIAEVKAIACELPALRAVPLSRFSTTDVRTEVLTCGLVEEVSRWTIWRWLDEDALRPWRHRAWSFPRDPDFTARPGWSWTRTTAALVVADSARTTTSCARMRSPRSRRAAAATRPSPPPGRGRCGWNASISPAGRLAYLAAWDGAVRRRATGVVGGRQRLQPPRPAWGRPSRRPLAERAPDPPAGPCALAEPGRELPVGGATQAADPLATSATWGGGVAAGGLGASLPAHRPPVRLAVRPQRPPAAAGTTPAP